VRDFSRKIPSADIDVYFIARPVFRTAWRFIYDHKAFTVEFRNRIEVVGPVQANELKASIQNYASLGLMYGSGADMDGWIVVGSLNGKIFDLRASSQTLLEIAQENKRQQESLVAMVAAYHKAVPKNRAPVPSTPTK
jgi:hypothetical protein